MTELLAISTREIRSALLRAIPGAPIVRIVREPVHASVERIRVRRASGERHVVIAKLGGRRGTNREMLAYQHLLAPEKTCSPRLLGAVQPENWLFLEEIAGHAPAPDDPGQVQALFESLAAVHRRCASEAPRLLRGFAAPALRASPRTTLTLTDYATGFLRAHTALRQVGIALPLGQQAERVARRLHGTGLTLVHGDLHLGNALLTDQQTYLLDWEDCGVGSPLHDLVYLEPEEGGWPGAPQGEMAWFALRIYHESGPLAHLPWEEFLLAQRSARLWDRLRLVALHAERVLTARAEGAPQGALDVMEETLQAALARSARAARTLQW